MLGDERKRNAFEGVKGGVNEKSEEAITPLGARYPSSSHARARVCVCGRFVFVVTEYDAERKPN